MYSIKYALLLITDCFKRLFTVTWSVVWQLCSVLFICS